MKQPHVAHQLRAQELRDEALVAVVLPAIAQHAHGIAGPGDVGEPLAVLVARLLHDAGDVLHHGKAQRVGVVTAEGPVVEIRLADDVGVRGQELEIGRLAELPLLREGIHDPVVAVGGAALVHHLGLALRVEILRDQPDDAQDLALPGPQARGHLLQEVEDVFLRQLQERLAPLQRRIALGRAGLGRQRAPEVVVDLLAVLLALALPALLACQIRALLAGIAVDALAHQRVGGVEHVLDRLMPVALFAAGDVALGEVEIVEDALRIGPLPEQIVVLEEVVMAEGGVGDHQRLHRRRVLLHHVGDARIGVDDDLVGQSHQAAAVARLLLGEVLAEGPVLVEQWHADRGIGIEHLLGGDDLDLVRVPRQAEFGPGHGFAGIVDAPDRLEVPVIAGKQQLARFGCCRLRAAQARDHVGPSLRRCLASPRGEAYRSASARASLRPNSSRNTG